MKTVTTLASAIALAALIAFTAHPSGAEDGAGPPQRGARGQRNGPGRRPPQGGHKLGAVMAADANRDGAVSAKEWQDFLVKIQSDFTKMDKNGDGALSKDEMPARPKRRGGAGKPGGRRGPDDAQGRRGPPEGRGPEGRRGPPEGRGPDGRRGPPEGRGPDDRRGPPEGRGPRGQGPDGQPGDGPQESVADLRARIDRLTALVEKLLAESKATDR